MTDTDKTKSPRTKKAHKEKSKPITNDQLGLEAGDQQQHRIEISYKDCELVNVTVFSERAELTRKVCVELKEGVNDVCVSGISNSVVQDSIRVNGGTAKSTEVVILEVMFGKNFLKQSEPSNIEEIQKQIELQNESIALINTNLKRIQEEETWLHGFADSVKNPKPGKDGESQDFLDAKYLEKVFNFMQFYRENLERIDKRREDAQAHLKAEKEKLSALEKTKKFASAPPKGHVNEVDILVKSGTATKVELLLSYVLLGPSWNSSYDARVDSSSSVLQFLYYGNITNTSGEDFTNTELCLSTAAPSVAGRPPELFGKLVSLRTKIEAYHHSSSSQIAPMSNLKVHAPMQQQMLNRAIDEPTPSPKAMKNEAVNSLSTTNTQSMTSTIFNIPRKVTINSDNKPHKVTVDSIALNAAYSYTIVPSQPKAYLKASVVNTTTFPFLAGSMNVFVDNNFVAKSNIDLLNPGESMGIFLGIDAAIKVEHQELKNSLETQGYLSKSNKKTIHLNTVVTNTKKEDIKLTIFQHLPRSTHGDVKVTLKEPQIEEGANAKIKLTPANNIERIHTIKAGVKEGFGIIYNIEYPIEKEIEMT